MFLNKKLALLALCTSLSLVSCNEYQKALKSTDTKVKYDAAESFYKAGNYRQANRLFEQIAPKYIGKPQGERVLFFFADSYFKIKDYNTAGYQFERFLKSYPNSDKSIEAAFFSAKSYYELSPKYSLDQTDTDKALAKLQNFINAYGESPYVEEANILAKELRVKKEQKAYEIAKQAPSKTPTRTQQLPEARCDTPTARANNLETHLGRLKPPRTLAATDILTLVQRF